MSHEARIVGVGIGDGEGRGHILMDVEVDGVVRLDEAAGDEVADSALGSAFVFEDGRGMCEGDAVAGACDLNVAAEGVHGEEGE